MIFCFCSNLRKRAPEAPSPCSGVKNFSPGKPDQIFGLHIGPEYPVGTIATRPGILFANTSELYIDLIGVSGHDLPAPSLQ